jgi:putative redox protein
MDVFARSLKNLQVEIRAGEHRWVADEPVGVGEDQGPNPYDLLLGALAACKVMTCHMYADRKGWTLDTVHVALRIDRIWASDCQECVSDPKAKVDLIDTWIRFEGDLSPDQIERLTEISERCPVHRSLTSETRIRTMAGEPV